MESRINPLLLCASAVLLSFISLFLHIPVIAFVCLAPLFAVIDAPAGKIPWLRFGLIALTVALVFGAERLQSHVVPAFMIMQGISVALSFAMYWFARQILGIRTSKLLIILFWLAMEYILVAVGLAPRTSFVADFAPAGIRWTFWTVNTGYLGLSLWLLLSNWLFCRALLEGKPRAGFAVLFAIVVFAPLALYGLLSVDYPPTGRADMIALYNGTSDATAYYAARGEWVPRTAAWVSALVLLYVAVKSKTGKK